jgi:hypothetical protein
MIVFRHADPRFPFLWEGSGQPAARWHAEGEGPAHYFSSTPDGAWAEFMRHEGITDAADLAGVRRALWAVELPVEPFARPRLPAGTLRGDLDSYEDCQAEARRLRAAGAAGLETISAAVRPATASGWRVTGGLRRGRPRSERVFVLFGARPDLTGWAACSPGRPRADLLPRVNHLDSD